ncbi:MAG: FliM/FliN family flagellar motor switch protein [Acidobacteriota bacterium]
MADGLNSERLTGTLTAEFGAALEAVHGRMLTLVPAATEAGPGWTTPITASGALTGTFTAALDAAGVRDLAAQVMELDEEPEDSVVADMLRSLWTQAAAAACRKDGVTGLTLLVGEARAGTVAGELAGWRLRDGDTTVATISIEARVLAGNFTGAGAGVALPGYGADLQTLAAPGNLAALLDIDLPLVVRFARTELTLRALTMLGPGSMVDMGRSPDDPVQLLVGSQVIAEGEVVVVGGNYGVRITSLVSPAERLKAMEL